MALGRKTGGRDFVKGKKYGPGAPPLTKEIIEARALNKREAEKTLNKFLYLPLQELALFLKDNSNTVHEMLIARILIEAIKVGDHHRLEWIYQRLLGKMKEDVNVTVTDQQVLIDKWRSVDPIEHIKLLREVNKVDEPSDGK